MHHYMYHVFLMISFDNTISEIKVTGRRFYAMRYDYGIARGRSSKPAGQAGKSSAVAQMFRRWASPAASIVVVLLLMVLGLDAQQLPQESEPLGPRFFVNIGGFISNGIGHEFGELVGAGGGLNGGVGFAPVASERNFLLRADLGFSIYGTERTPACFTQPCWIKGDLVTDNTVFYAGAGPEILLKQDGRWQPYLYGTVGPSWFTTRTAPKGAGENCDCRITHLNDVGVGWRIGGGTRFKVSESLLIDFGIVYNGNGLRQYLTDGDLALNPDGSVSMNTRRGTANLLALQLGLSWGINTGAHRLKQP